MFYLTSKFHVNCINTFGFMEGGLLNPPPPGPGTPKKPRQNKVNIMLRIDIALQYVPCNMYVVIKKSSKVALKVDSCNMSRKHGTVLCGKSMLKVDPCNTAFITKEGFKPGCR